MSSKNIVICVEKQDGDQAFIDAARSGADYVLVYDHSATRDDIDAYDAWLKNIVTFIDIPVIVGGGIGRFEDVKKLLYAGAEKVVVDDTGDATYLTDSIEKIITSKKDVISVNHEPILSNKAVALYFDANDYPHYIYDTSHSCLEIHEPFTAIYNSGQMWKFSNPSSVREICRHLNPTQEQGTNLEIIQQYFGVYKSQELDIISICLWFNCNTVADYREAIKALSK